MRCERPELCAPGGCGAERDGSPPGWRSATRGGGRPSAAALRRSRDGYGGGSAWRSLHGTVPSNHRPRGRGALRMPGRATPEPGVWLSLRQVGLLGQPEAARLRRAAGQAGARERARDVAAGAVGRRGQLGALGRAAGRRRVGSEDLLRGLAGEQGLELLALDRLPLEQQFGDLRERLPVLGEDVLGLLVGALDDAADLVVDLARDLVGVVGLGGELAAHERLAVVV